MINSSYNYSWLQC